MTTEVSNPAKSNGISGNAENAENAENAKSARGRLPLPESQEMAIRQGLTAHHELVAERNTLAREAFQLRADVAAYKVASDAQQSLNAELESRMATLRAERDEAVANMVTFRTVLIGIQGILRTFAIEHEPLMKALTRGETDHG